MENAIVIEPIKRLGDLWVACDEADRAMDAELDELKQQRTTRRTMPSRSHTAAKRGLRRRRGKNAPKVDGAHRRFQRQPLWTIRKKDKDDE